MPVARSRCLLLILLLLFSPIIFPPHLLVLIVVAPANSFPPLINLSPSRRAPLDSRCACGCLQGGVLRGRCMHMCGGGGGGRRGTSFCKCFQTHSRTRLSSLTLQVLSSRMKLQKVIRDHSEALLSVEYLPQHQVKEGRGGWEGGRVRVGGGGGRGGLA